MSQIWTFVTQIPIGVSAVGPVVMQIEAGVSRERTGGAQTPAVVHAECSFVSHPRVTTLRSNLDVP